MPNAQATYLQTIERLLEENEVEKAIDALLQLDDLTRAGIRQDVILQSGNFREANKMFHRNLISFDEYSRISARTRFGLLDLMREVPGRIERDAQVRSLATYQFQVPDNARLEKLLGDRNNLLKINWLEKALQASKAVCRVVCSDGELGTGFLTREGYIFTNNHVLPTTDIARDSRVEFNYELDSNGNVKTRTAYELDSNDFSTSPSDQLDFTRIRVIDRPDAPLSQWGFVEFDPSAIPVTNEPVTIIQHPKGEDKQIALNANDVLSVWNQYLFYTTDTEPGSSGSPVFNKDWKVVAIHHAGKSDAEGGLQINARGDRRGANRGILFRDIFQYINNGSPKPSTPEVHTPPPPPGSPPAQPHESVAGPKKEANPPRSAVPRFVVLYDESDQPLCDRLNNHLFVLKNTKKMQVYNVHKAKAGEDVEMRAREELAGADYILVLITPNLFNENAPWFSMTLEALEEGRRVIPVKLQKINIDGTGLEKLRSLPAMNRAVSEYANTDAAYAEIVEELKKLI